MGATNRTKLSYVAEDTAGTTPPNPVFKEMRVTSNGLVYEPTRTTSNEISADRQVSDHILTRFQAGGDLGIELSFKASDDLLEAALQGTWAAKAERDNAGVADSVITAVTAASDTYTVTDAAVDFAAGHLVHASGFSNASNNGLFRAQAGTSGTSVAAPPAAGLADEAVPPAAARLKAVGFEGEAGDITATATGLASTTLDFTTLGVQVGEWHKIGGDGADAKFAGTAANNGWARVGAVTQNAITYDVLPTGWGVDAAAGQTIQVFFGDFLKNGTTQRSFSFELQQQDIPEPSFEVYKGQQVNTMALQLRAGEIITGTFGLVGMTMEADTVRVAGATDVAAPTFGKLNAASNVGRLFENNVAVAGPSYLMEVGIDINNNLERQFAIGSLGAIGIRNGELALGGTLNAYFGDLSLLNKVINDTESSLMFKVGRSDGDRNAYVVDIPSIKVTGTAPVPGKNQDRMFQGRFDAKRHATQGFTIGISRFWYLPAAA